MWSTARAFSPPAAGGVLHYRHARVNRFLTVMSNFFTDLDLTDMETCYKVFRTELLKSMPLRSNDFASSPRSPPRSPSAASGSSRYRSATSAELTSKARRSAGRDGFKAVAAMFRFWLVDDAYAADEYGSQILTSLERRSGSTAGWRTRCAPHVGARVLEIGAGIGNITVWLLPRDSWVASDINPTTSTTCATSRRRSPTSRWRGWMSSAATISTALRGRFDTVICLNVLEHVGDPLQALRNMRSALSPGGKLVLYVPHGQRLYSSLDEVLGHRCRYDRAMLAPSSPPPASSSPRPASSTAAAVPGWWWNGKVLRRRSFSRLQLKLFDLAVPLLRRFDRFLPWNGLGLVAIARRVEDRPD